MSIIASTSLINGFITQIQQLNHSPGVMILVDFHVKLSFRFQLINDSGR
jgi:hypothetical protein